MTKIAAVESDQQQQNYRWRFKLWRRGYWQLEINQGTKFGYIENIHQRIGTESFIFGKNTHSLPYTRHVNFRQLN